MNDKLKIPVEYATKDLRFGCITEYENVYNRLKAINEEIFSEVAYALQNNPNDDVFVTTSYFHFICIVLISKEQNKSSLTFIDTHNEEAFAKSVFSKMREYTPERALMFLKTFYEMKSAYPTLSGLATLSPASFLD